MRAVLKKKLRAQLDERRRELAAAFKRSKETQRRNSGEDGPLDLADTATELYTQEFNYSLSENDRAQLQLIDAALERMDDGDYGDCEECGEKITETRLKAIPWAALCIECQELKEAVSR
ncbi:MAG TPA: TraR/DksA family transcriptional regulator [Acidobacteriota bacterium]|nr:TraR/DksA family transcriptional regulator [Acidobacteriota bacterium]